MPSSPDTNAVEAKERHPERYKRRVLLCVAGLTPATITETLYALVVPQSVATASEAPAPRSAGPSASPVGWMAQALGGVHTRAQSLEPSKHSYRAAGTPWMPFVPTEIHLITTAKSRENMIRGLLHPSEGAPNGQLRLLMEEHAAHFGNSEILFGESQIHVIERDGRPVFDIDSPEDSAATGDTILEVLRDLAADDDCAIHASIAGGRKSMSFLLGMCMSLLGRRQDRMSHVLVREEFEVPDFFFPPAKPRMVVGKHRKEISSAEAHITLASLPLLRVFDGLGLKLRDPEMGFADVIELGEMAIESQLIRVIPSQRAIQIGHRRCKLTEAEMFLYTLLAIRRRDGLVVEDDEHARAGGVRFKVGSEAGFDGQPLQRARMYVPSYDFAGPSESLKSRISKINAKLEGAFTPELAGAAKIIGPTASKGDAIYGLFGVEQRHLYVQ